MREEDEEQSRGWAQSRKLHVGDPGRWEAADPSLGVEAAVLFGKTVFRSLSGDTLRYVAGAIGPVTGDIAHGFVIGVFACVEKRITSVNRL